MSERLPHGRFTTIDGESHLGGLGVATEVLGRLMELGPRSTADACRSVICDITDTPKTVFWGVWLA